jgi:hypothetical protein
MCGCCVAFPSSTSDAWALVSIVGRMEARIGVAGETLTLERGTTPTATSNNRWTTQEMPQYKAGQRRVGVLGVDPDRATTPPQLHWSRTCPQPVTSA